MASGLTRVGDANSDVAALELLAVKVESLLQTIEIGKLGVSESFGAVFDSVLDDADTGDSTVGKEIGDGFLSGLVGQVAKVSSVGRSRGKLSRERIARSVGAAACRDIDVSCVILQLKVDW